MAYNAMRNVVEDDYLQGLQYGLKAFLITGAIVIGLVFAEVIIQLIFRSVRSSKVKLQKVYKNRRRLRAQYTQPPYSFIAFSQ